MASFTSMNNERKGRSNTFSEIKLYYERSLGDNEIENTITKCYNQPKTILPF